MASMGERSKQGDPYGPSQFISVKDHALVTVFILNGYFPAPVVRPLTM
jgi:hypothetical protein